MRKQERGSGVQQEMMQGRILRKRVGSAVASTQGDTMETDEAKQTHTTAENRSTKQTRVPTPRKPVKHPKHPGPAKPEPQSRRQSNDRLETSTRDPWLRRSPLCQARESTSQTSPFDTVQDHVHVLDFMPGKQRQDGLVSGLSRAGGKLFSQGPRHWVTRNEVDQEA